MAETDTITYRISEEVDTELRRLAKIHKGVDRALRVVLGIGEQAATSGQLDRIARQVTPRQVGQRGVRPKGSDR